MSLTDRKLHMAIGGVIVNAYLEVAFAGPESYPPVEVIGNVMHIGHRFISSGARVVR